MRRTRMLLVFVLSLTPVMLAAPPAYAYCAPDEGTGETCPPCDGEKVNALWRKVTGQDLFYCPM